MFSVLDLSQSHFSAEFLPQEHLAWVAQTQPDSDLPQHVDETVMMFVFECRRREFMF